MDSKVRSAWRHALRGGSGLAWYSCRPIVHIFTLPSPQSFTAFALCAIAITFWHSGIGPGILAALLAALIRTFFFEPGVETLSRIVYDLVFGIFAVLMIQATRARNEVEVRVAERTTALTQANQDLTIEIAERSSIEEKLRQSESYLAQAQSLAHIGSWAWEIAGRKTLYASEELYRIYAFNPNDGLPTWEARLQRVHRGPGQISSDNRPSSS